MPRRLRPRNLQSARRRKSNGFYVDDNDSESDDWGVSNSSSDDSDFVPEEVAPEVQPMEVDGFESSDGEKTDDGLSGGSQMRVQKAEAPKVRGSKKGNEGEELDWVVWQRENTRWISNFIKENEENSKLDDLPLTEVAEPSPDVILPLLRFQKEWLFWALKQESSETRGGILADEMGMGKTIQAITLVLTSRFLRGHHSGIDMGSCSSSSVFLRTGCTLVVCPVVAVIQWVGEIDRYTEKGSTRVLVYHGANRGKVKYNFDDYDFVITTYSTIESDFRKYMMPPKERCKWCGKMFYARKLQVHLKYFCGPTARRTEKQAKQTRKNKKIISVSKKGNRVKGAKKDAHDINVCVNAQGKGKRKTEYDVPTDNVAGSSEGKSILHSVIWERIILDEAHFIKDRQCNTAKAIFALESEYKWALSGTPLQNRVGELYSLVRFLQINPFSYFFCKDCNCKVLERGSAKQCNACPHSTVRHFCWWNRNISTPIQKHSNSHVGRSAMILLKERVLKNIVLRRTKDGRAADLALPPRIVYLRRNSLDKNENEFYEALYTQSRVQFDTYAVAGTLMNNYAHIFDLLTRLRQAVDHPYLVVYSKTAAALNERKDDAANQECGICHEPPEDAVVSSCDHFFCKSCLIDISATMGNMACPTCSKPLTVDFTTNNSGKRISKTVIKGYKSGILNRLNHVEAFQTSTKIDALKEEIRNMLEDDGSAKGIVFSQFTSFLDLIHFSLHESGVKCVQLVGTMSLAERDKAIKSFTEDGECKIFLMSLKAGGVALNLTVASHVFMMDPWWNPAVERQAQDRIHRIGQYKPIRIVRFVIEGTIEERILKLQEKKELVFQGTLENSEEALAKLTEADLRFLFQL